MAVREATQRGKSERQTREADIEAERDRETERQIDRDTERQRDR